MDTAIQVHNHTVSLDLTLEDNARLADVKRAINMIKGIVKVRIKTVAKKKTGMELALEDIAEGRINHYSSLDELKAKFADVQR